VSNINIGAVLYIPLAEKRFLVVVQFHGRQGHLTSLPWAPCYGLRERCFLCATYATQIEDLSIWVTRAIQEV